MSRSTKALAILTGLMTLMALALPFAGTALATHGAEPVAVADVEPEQDSASTGTCNAYTITARDDDVDFAESEVIDALLQQTFKEGPALNPNQNAPDLGFCTPTTEQAAGSAPNATPTCASTDEANDPNQDTRECRAEFTTDAQGRVVFGITSDQAGQVQVTVFAEAQDPDCTPEQSANNDPDAAGACQEPQDSATKTFTAGGQAGAGGIDCEPEFATNNLDAGDTTHQFACDVENAAGDPAAGVEVDFIITAGPNADIDTLPGVQPSRGTCTTTTGTEGNPGQGTVGEANCTYDEDIDLEPGEPGTDTIVAFVDQDNDNAADATEPQDEILKAWTLAPRNIDCEPETATNNPGDEPHEVTCSVTDVEGAAVGDVVVTFSENGVGRFEGNASRTTGNDGRVTITTTAQQSEEGVQEITGTISDEDASTGGRQGGNTDPNAECHRAANDPSQGDPAGNCEDQVLKTWSEPDAPPPPPECSDGVDNDGDGFVDTGDFNCSSSQDDSEAGPLPGGACANERAIRGTDDNDVLIGTPDDDLICGFGGNDTLRGRSGNDVLLGHDGDDTLEGADDSDTLRGGADEDALEGGDNKDILRGGSGGDTLKGNKGHDTLRGGRGHDVLRGGRGHDTMRGGRGNDSCRDRFGNNVFRSCER